MQQFSGHEVLQEPAPWPRHLSAQRVLVVIASLTIVGVAFASMVARSHLNGMGACAVVSANELAAATHHPVPPGRQSAADGPYRDATVCRYAAAATVFAVGPKHDEGSQIYGSVPPALGPPILFISNESYRATMARDTAWTDLFVLRHGQYVNVRVPTDITTESAEMLIKVVAARIK